MNSTILTFSSFVAKELRASSPYKTGYMQSSITRVVVDNDTVDIIIGAPYSSYVNQRNPHKRWVEDVVERCTRCFFQNKVDATSMRAGIRYQVISGSNG